MSDDVVRRWLDGLAKSTGENRLPLVQAFFEFAGVEPLEAVEFQRENPLDYRFVDIAYKWVENKNLAMSTMETRVGCVRGFFLANRAPLPQDKHRFHSDKTPVVGELSVEELHKILTGSTLDYRAAYLIMFQSGSGVGELLYINTHLANHVWDEVRKGKKIIRLNMPGRKQNRNVRPYYTFIGADATEALRHLFHSRGWQKDAILFRTEYGDPVSANSLQGYFRNRAFKLGIIKPRTPACVECGGETVKVRHRIGGKKGLVKIYYLCTVCHVEHPASDYDLGHHEWSGIRYRMKTHELRDLFRTEFERGATYTGANDKAGEFFMGHIIDRLLYNKIMNDKSFGLEQYRKVMPFLNILSENPRKINRAEIDSKLEARDAEVEVLRDELGRVRKKLENLSWLSDPEIAKDVVEGLKLLRKKEKGT